MFAGVTGKFVSIGQPNDTPATESGEGQENYTPSRKGPPGKRSGEGSAFCRDGSANQNKRNGEDSVQENHAFGDKADCCERDESALEISDENPKSEKDEEKLGASQMIAGQERHGTFLMKPNGREEGREKEQASEVEPGFSGNVMHHFRNGLGFYPGARVLFKV